MELIKCPSCGATVQIENPGLAMTACSYCKSTIYRDSDDVLKAGIQSLVPENDSRFYLGCSGTILNKQFTVLGQMRFAYPQGSWDEWYISYDSGYAWLGEDGRNLSLRQIVAPGEAPENLPQLGEQFTYAGQTYYVRERDQATCISFYGELPWAVLPGEKIEYADAASTDGTRFAIFCQNCRQQKRFTLGIVIQHEDLTIYKQPQLATPEAREGYSWQCLSCGAAMPPPIITEALTQVCPSCGAIHDLSSGQPEFKVKALDIYARGFDLPLGAKATFEDNISYQICGRQLVSYSDGGTARLYLLYNPEKGYRYLEKEEGHFTFLRQTHQAPDQGDADFWFILDEDEPLQVGGRRYTVDCNGYSSVLYVDGAFPWRVTIGDRSQYVDAWYGSTFYGLEKTATEVEFYTGPKLSTSTVLKKFGVTEAKTSLLADGLKGLFGSKEISLDYETVNDVKVAVKQALHLLEIIVAIVATFSCICVLVILFFTGGPTPQEQGKNALETIQKKTSAFNKDIRNPWEKATQYQYVNQDVIISYDNRIQNLSAMYDATTDDATEIKQLLNTSAADEKRLQEVSQNLQKQLDNINKFESKIRHDVTTLLTPYAQALEYLRLAKEVQTEVKELKNTTIEENLGAPYQQAQQFFPIKMADIKVRQALVNASRQNFIVLYDRFTDLKATEENLGSLDLAPINQSGLQLTNSYKEYRENFTNLQERLEDLFWAREEVLVDLIIDDSGDKVKFYENTKIVSTYLKGDTISLRQTYRLQSITHTVYNYQENSLGQTISGKKLGEFSEDIKNTPVTPGTYLLDSPLVKNLEHKINKELFNNCSTQINGETNLEWFKKCYPQSQYAISNGWVRSKYIMSGRTYLVKPKPRRTSSHSGSRSHGGK